MLHRVMKIQKTENNIHIHMHMHMHMHGASYLVEQKETNNELLHIVPTSHQMPDTNVPVVQRCQSRLQFRFGVNSK